MIQLIIGGARSGKSRYGESVVAKFSALGQHCVYVATAQAGDDEMRQRIKRHQDDRASAQQLNWQLIEEPLWLAERLQAIDKPNQTIFVDCLTLYLAQHLGRDTSISHAQGNAAANAPHSNATHSNATLLNTQASSTASTAADSSRDWQQQRQHLLAILPTLASNVILISNEVGSGIVPLGELSREFVDQAGWLNQAIAAIADEVTLVVAGLPMSLKQGQVMS